MKHIRITFALVALIALVSCEKEIEFNGEITEPLVVVNSFLVPDSTIRVSLTKSRFFLDSKTQFDKIDDATVRIVINNDQQETLQFAGKGNYTGNYQPRPGDSVAIVVRVPGYTEEIRSSAVIPAVSNIISVDTLSKRLVKRIPGQYNDDTVFVWINEYEMEMGIKIKDPSQIKNFYRLSVIYNELFLNDPNHFTNRHFLYFNLQGISTESSGGGLISIIDAEQQKEFHVFNDELFDGKEIVIRFKMNLYLIDYPSGENPTPTEISYHVNLQSISQPVYLYLKTNEAMDDVISELFSEPVQIYTNIENGIGIFGALTNNIRVIK